ncbi:MAG: 30S ribosomal protein S17 [Coriobacteriia bacterium]
MSKRNQRKTRQGVVISRSGDKTAVVEVAERKPHALYKKMIRRTSKYHVHDEDNVTKVGDKVLIMETRPLSKLKRWRLVEVVEEAK